MACPILWYGNWNHKDFIFCSEVKDSRKWEGLLTFDSFLKHLWDFRELSGNPLKEQFPLFCQAFLNTISAEEISTNSECKANGSLFDEHFRKMSIFNFSRYKTKNIDKIAKLDLNNEGRLNRLPKSFPYSKFSKSWIYSLPLPSSWQISNWLPRFPLSQIPQVKCIFKLSIGAGFSHKQCNDSPF